MIINQSNLSALFAGFKTVFQSAFDGAPSHLDVVAMTVPSQARDETYAWLGAFPGIRPWIGPRQVKNLSMHSYKIKNEPFEMTVSVPRDDIEDDKFGVFGPMFAEMGRRAKQHPEQLIFTLMQNGFTTEAYDGQFFFDTDHPVLVDGVEQSVANTDGGTGAPWFLLDTSRAVKPFIFQERRRYDLARKDQPSDENVFNNREFVYGVDSRSNVGVGLWQLAWGSKQTLDKTTYAAARKAMREFKDDEGVPLGIMPDTLICAPALEENALEILNAERDAAGASNVWKGTAKLIISPYLA